jgi:hypothetical protein
MLDNFYRDSLDDEELVLTIACIKQVLPVAQYPLRAELSECGDLDVIEFRESDLVQVVLGHASASSWGQRTSRTNASTA